MVHSRRLHENHFYTDVGLVAKVSPIAIHSKYFVNIFKALVPAMCTEVSGTILNLFTFYHYICFVDCINAS